MVLINHKFHMSIFNVIHLLENMIISIQLERKSKNYFRRMDALVKCGGIVDYSNKLKPLTLVEKRKLGI